ncbi:hypothetical protein MMC20_003097 [Loxospora ochrophaea]|nr:hypothetical protein [Loxospora ochrophaea]
MLRLPASRIELGVRDLEWHTDRHRDRLPRWTSGYPPDVQSERAKWDASTQQNLGERRPVAASVPETSLVSDEPVPRDSRPFWDGILRDAGMLGVVPEQRLQSHGGLSRPLPYRPTTGSSDSRDHDGDERLGDVTIYGEDEELLRHKSYRTSDDISESFPSASNVSGHDFDDESDINDTRSLEEERLHFRSLRRRLSFFKLHRRTHPTNGEDDVSLIQRRFSSQIDLDGTSDCVPSDSGPDNRSSWTRSSEYGVCRSTSSGTSKAQSGADEAHQERDPSARAHGEMTRSWSIDEPDNPPRTSPKTLPRAADSLRSRLGGLPRSPLYIAQLASSPEKSFKSPAEFQSSNAPEPNNATDSASLSYIARRPRNYKRRSQSYSYVESEAWNDETATNGPNNDDSDSTISSGPASSPPKPFHGSQSVLKHSPSAARHHYRNECLDYAFLMDEPRSSPALPALPPPFSSNARNVSINPLFPSSSSDSAGLPSPSNFALPSGFRTATSSAQSSPSPIPSPYNMQSQLSQPLMRHVPSPTPPLPTTPYRSMRVYDDSLPASSQPQTPMDSRSVGLPIARNAAYTAPVGALGRHQYYTALPTRTPTRERRQRNGIRGAEQENVGLEAEGLRAWVSQIERRRERAEEHGLERTPPSERR